MKNKVVVFWFRRDLRLEDNKGLIQALQSGFPVIPIFIFDSTILNKLDNKKDRRVDYIHQTLAEINHKLTAYDSSLNTYYGVPGEIFINLTDQYDIQSVYCNRDYEPQAIERDSTIKNILTEKGVLFHSHKDQVIFECHDVVKNDGTAYTVYTPYSKRWKETLKKEDYTVENHSLEHFFKQKAKTILSLDEIGFQKTEIIFESPFLDTSIISEYDKYRDFPALQRTTQLGIALRFGTISIRKCVGFAIEHNQTWLNELIWREFFMQILYFYPNAVNQSFKAKYDHIAWRNNEFEFLQWCEGNTGYPIVDAGMRQLNATGYMHNRVRMIVASFLCKHLLIDWRWGEAYFAEKLDDYDLSANNGNWQWAAGCGCDAAPYFRVFNPTLQTAKFDKDLVYIKKWVPEFQSLTYTQPIVDHNLARERALRVYKQALNDNL